MPRRLTGPTGGLVFHVMNRGIRKSTLFTSPAEFAAFIQILHEAAERVKMRVVAFHVMGTHWHLILWPINDGDLSAYVGWLSLTHACRHQRARGTRGQGPVYQGRFKAIPIQTDIHLLTAIRYVERNACRAGLVSRSEEWPWSSASLRPGAPMPELDPGPTPRLNDWQDILNRPEPELALAAIRERVQRSYPYGSDEWCDETVRRLGWKTGCRRPGRPIAGL